LRVGFLLSGTLDAITGGYIYDRQLVEYLRQKGHQVELIHLAGRNYLDRLLQNPRLPLSMELNHLALDILLQDELDHPALILLNRGLKRQAGCPIISIVHHLRSSEFRPRWQNQIYGRIEKLYLTSVDGFIFNSRATRATVENLVGIPQPGVIAYPCGDRLPNHITESEIIDRARSPGPLRVLFLGNLIRRKALHVLLTALAELPENSFFLTVIGDLSMDKTYVNTIREQIRENNLTQKVVLLGAVTDSELASRLKENHVLVVPSYYEGFGIAYLEGMGFGLPAIGTTAGAANEVITHGRDGFLIPAGESSLLSQHLLEINNERDRLESMSLNAYRRFNSHPTWQTTCESICNFLMSWKTLYCPR
jgi:glycosyltransferase involved in cell wall biosynthesis